MHWFNEVVWSEVVLAAVACVSVTGVWVTFWPGHRKRLRKLRELRLGHLRRVGRELQHIRHWAAPRSPDLHDPEWYSAAWQVSPFRWQDVERFNQVVIEGDYRRDLTEALVALELAAQRFHERLEEQLVYLRGAPKGIERRWPAAVAASKAKGAALTTEELDGIPSLCEHDRTWLCELYERNRANHIDGIGGPGGNGLHEAWRRASDALAVERVWLQTGDESRWRYAGHITAALFAVLGVLFLIDFVWSFTDARLHPRSRSIAVHAIAPAPDDSAGTGRHGLPAVHAPAAASTHSDAGTRGPSARHPHGAHARA